MGGKFGKPVASCVLHLVFHDALLVGDTCQAKEGLFLTRIIFFFVSPCLFLTHFLLKPSHHHHHHHHSFFFSLPPSTLSRHTLQPHQQRGRERERERGEEGGKKKRRVSAQWPLSSPPLPLTPLFLSLSLLSPPLPPLKVSFPLPSFPPSSSSSTAVRTPLSASTGPSFSLCMALCAVLLHGIEYNRCGFSPFSCLLLPQR